MANLQSKAHDIDSLVEQILSEKRPEHVEKKPKPEEGHKESSVSPQKTQSKRKLELVSFVGEVNIGKEIIVISLLVSIFQSL